MFRRLLQYSFLLVLALLVGVVSSNAQNLGTKGFYRAEIPFDFTVGDKNYQAGEYRIRLERLGAGDQAVIFGVEGTNGALLIRLFALQNGDRSRDDIARLYFTRFGDDRFNYVLKKVVSPEFGYTVPVSKTATAVRITRNLKRKPMTVEVALIALN